MSPRDFGARWDAMRARGRARVARLIPASVTNYPFEVIAGCLALLMGLPFLLGTTAPATLVALVGTVAFHAWSAALALGGLTILAGLRLPARPNPLILAAGLQLAGGSFGVYAIAVMLVLGAAGWTGITVYSLLCVLAMARATHFRRIVDIQKGATRLQDEGER